MTLEQRVEVDQSRDSIEQVVYEEKKLTESAREFRKKYFRSIHYAMKYERAISIVVSILAAIITTTILCLTTAK